MSKLLRAGLFALAMVHTSNVQALTLRTLLDSQLSADIALKAESEE